MVVRGGILAAAALLFALPYANTPGLIAAGVAVSVGVVAASRVAGSRVRSSLIVVAATGVAVTGLYALPLLAAVPGVPQLLGPGSTLTVGDVLTWGLFAFGVVVGLRTLSQRYPPAVVGEIAAVVGVVAGFFSGHRRYPYSQPQFLSDWSFAAGFDPPHVLIVIGVVTLIAIGVLLLPRQRPARTAVSLVVLLLIGFGLYLLLTTGGPGGASSRPVVAAGTAALVAPGNSKGGQPGQPSPTTPTPPTKAGDSTPPPPKSPPPKDPPPKNPPPQPPPPSPLPPPPPPPPQPPPPQDPPPELSIDDVKLKEGDVGTTMFVFTVNMSKPSRKPVRVDYATVPVTARPGEDYIPINDTLVIPPGRVRAGFIVLVVGDTKVEPDETFTVELSNPVNAVIRKGSGIGTIINDDGDVPPPPPPPKEPLTVGIDDVMVKEGDTGTTPATFRLTLSEPSDKVVKVDVQTVAGTATPGEDFVPLHTTVSFPPGMKFANVTVQVIGDTKVEPDEAFMVRLSNPVNVTIQKGEGVCTILNDDKEETPPDLTIDDVTAREGNEGKTPFRFTVQLSHASDKPVSVDYATVAGTATAGEDFEPVAGRLTIPPGEVSGEIVVQVIGDTVVEPDETFVVRLSNPENATLKKAEGVGTIQNDDQVPKDEPLPEDEFDWGRTGPPDLKPILLARLRDDFDPVEKGYYFRTLAFSQLRHGRLVRAEAVDTDIVWRTPAGPLAVPAGGQHETVKPLTTTTYLIGEHHTPPGLVQLTSLEPNDNPAPNRFTAVWGIKSAVLTAAKRGERTVPAYEALLSARTPAGWSEETRQHYQALPADPRYRELAGKIAAGLTPAQQASPLCRALAVRRWMEANLTYDYNPAHKTARDPAASFLFGDRRGYAVHLAHVMCYLLRAQEIPARVAIGHRVPVDRRGQRAALMAYTVDEHAWAEMYLNGPGWVVVEAGTAGRIPPPDPEPDPKELDSYLAAITDLPPDLVADDPVARVGFNPRYLIALLPAVLLGLFGLKGWRQFVPRVAPRRILHRVAYRAVLDRLAEVVVRREYGETWDDFAERVAAAVPEFVPLTEAHLRAAYGGRDPLDRAGWLALRRQALARIERAYPAYRRWRGRLNPFSWLGVR
jgi:transglutaminase-like putative cysteine protease